MRRGFQSATAGDPIHWPQTFEGKSFVQITLYERPPGSPMSDPAPQTINHQPYTLICHYSGAPHERWGQTPGSEKCPHGHQGMLSATPCGSNLVGHHLRASSPINAADEAPPWRSCGDTGVIFLLNELSFPTDYVIGR
jgi:hypothetical protein